MVRGFIFDGVDIETIGLEYAPEMSQTFVYAGSTFKNFEESSDGQDGSYYYGNTLQPKQFQLRCFFEDTFINSGQPTRVEVLFRRGRTGKLIFKNRPWCYYIATVTKNVNFADLKSYLNGIVTINMTAYYPFARCDQMFINGNADPNANMLLESTGMFMDAGDNSSWGIVDKASNLTWQNVTDGYQGYLYNPGTERADLAISVSGYVSSGMIIHNDTTGQSMKITKINRDNTTNAGQELVVDSLNGKSLMVNTSTGAVVSNGYIYHDYGFIQLAPCTPIYRDVAITPERENVDNHLVFTGTYDLNSNQKYVLDQKLNDGNHMMLWKRSSTYVKELITGVSSDGTSFTPDTSYTTNLASSAHIVGVNCIRVEFIGGNSPSVNLKFAFKPTFA